MTTPNTPTPEGIAAGLTKAQREVFDKLYLIDRWHVDASNLTAAAGLVEAGLATAEDSYDEIQLSTTPLGLQVRQALATK